MLQYCVIVIFIALVPEAHPFKSNSSIIIYHLVDEFSGFILSELKHMVTWPSGNHFLGPVYSFAIHERYCADFSTLTIVEEPRINATYHKTTGTMVYHCDVVLGLSILHFGFILDLNIVGQPWESSDVRINANDNAWEVSFDVHVNEDGFCKVYFVDSAILYLGNYEIAIEPQNHFIRRWVLWMLTRGIVWTYHDIWNEMLKGTVREEFKSPGVIEVICKAFTSRNP
ncbi:unnamed protein product [Nezara viridula]|uniref:Uncharacterized protein n=1 Tax=Nezara viridula TaxID=85310 RepID=A0A9P0MUB0_NEZVI|nr:unnamed protein product [Nezara viridula]